jgi:Vps16, N-terminal region
MKSSLNAEFNRYDTLLQDAKSLEWCGNDAPVLTYPDKIIIVGPNEYESVDLRCAIQGIKSVNEIDGLRVVTTEKTYFLERV